MARSFEDRTAVVTGGASGIGRATAERFASEGANVVVADVATGAGRETVGAIESAGGTATFVETDVSDPAAVEGMIRKAVDRYGSLDVAHNNAGIGGEDNRLAAQSEEHWDRVMAVNLKGVWLCMKHELRVMAETGGGAVVNTASIAGLAAAGHAAYVASKHGVIGLTRVAAREYARDDVRVNAVCPGVVDTQLSRRGQEDPEEVDPYVDLQAFDRLGTPEEIAAAVVWLSSPEASFVTGGAYPVDGGYMAL
jgi:NAD(P)-dependent dehydrogenase (short-subunit alcohol dehydrogenase family)